MRYTIPTFVLFAGLVGCGDPAPEVPLAQGAPSSVTMASAQTLEDTDPPVVEPRIEEEIIEVVAAEPTVQEPALDSGPAPVLYTLRRGETLAHFARWSELPVEDIAAASELPLDGAYAVGTELALPIDTETRSIVEARRDAHHQVRAQNYLESRGAAGTDFYAVRTGDSAWTIARDLQGMPVWLLESLNPSVDLERLRPGQSLLVPVFNDIVAEAEEPGADAAEAE